MATITIFGSSICRENSYEYDTADLLGSMIGQAGFDIATGGYDGVMEAALKGASVYNVKRIGITTEYYKDKQKNNFVTEEIKTQTYFERLKELFTIADAYIILPGGTGTLLELAMVWAFKDRGLIGNKKIVVIGEQWSEVLQTMSFYNESILEKAGLIFQAETAKEAVDYLIENLV